MKNVLTTVKLNPITLVDCIVAPVGRMANVKIRQEAAVQRARWVDRNRITERKPCKAPFLSLISANTVRHKKQTIRAFDDGCHDQMDGRNGWDRMIWRSWRRSCRENWQFGNRTPDI